MVGLRHIGGDVARALVVLALVFLSFAHAPVAAASGDVLTATMDMSWCGDALDTGTDTTHAPCHACRLGAGADLPPPAELPLAPGEVADVLYGPLPVLALPATPLGIANARGPPSA